MTVKVVVTGSYREQEKSLYNFNPRQKDLFERTAQEIGRILAHQKCILLVSWSEANLDSQLGNRTEGQNHPYSETADFHALNGYLGAIEHHSELIEQGAKVEIKVSGMIGRSPRPFGKEVDFYKQKEIVEVRVISESDRPKYRSELLQEQASEADVFIIIGGGKATQNALETAVKRGVLLPLGFVGGVGKQAIARLSANSRQKLIDQVGALDKSENVNTIIAKLPTLINLITSETAMTSSPPNNGNNEPSAPPPNPEPSDNFWSFLKSLPPWLLLVIGVFGVFVIGVIIYLAYNGFEFILPGGVGLKRPQPGPTPSSNPDSSEAEKGDEVQVKVNYYCKWKSKGELVHPVQSAPVTASINGTPIPVSPSFTDINGKVSFKMRKKDEVEIVVTHPDRKDSQIQMPLVEIVESEDTLKNKEYVIRRDDCKLDKK